jgi:hypothetical protein
VVRIGIHTIFVARENILFLEEWLDYHAGLGITDFYLYDNSRSIGRNGSTSTQNKYGIEFDALTKQWSDQEVASEVARVASKCPARCELISWEPKVDQGRVVYEQCQSIVDCANRAGECDWLGFIDMDEFLFSPSGEKLEDLLELADECGGVTMLQKKFEDRFLNIGCPVTGITRCIEGIDTSAWAPKMFVRKGALKKEEVGIVHWLPVEGGSKALDPGRLRFNHYNVNDRLLDWARGGLPGSILGPQRG